jgi:osmotically-inducible protein OsmY
MANYSNRNERFAAGRERPEGLYGRDRDARRPRGDFPDWDRYGSYRDVGRGNFTAGDRETWQTDDLGYSDFGYSDGYRRSGAEYEGRGYGRPGFNEDRDSGQRRDFLDRASDEVASWFGDDDAERRRRMDQHRGKGPKGYIRTDERIREDVNDRLSDDPMLDASDVEVSVSGGEVTLDGKVASRQDKRRAEDLAESVSGVTHTQNNLRVKQGDQVTNIVS